MRVVSLTVIPREPLAKILLTIPIPEPCYQGRNISARDTTVVPVNWKVGLPSGHSGHSIPANQQSKKQGQLERLILTNKEKLGTQGEVRSSLWNAGNLLECLPTLPRPVIKWKTTIIHDPES